MSEYYRQACQLDGCPRCRQLQLELDSLRELFAEALGAISLTRPEITAPVAYVPLELEE